MTDLTALIAELEAAPKGSDDLDHKVLAALEIPFSYDEEGQFGAYKILPNRVRVTRSLDAARRLLIKEGWYWSCGQYTSGKPWADARNPDLLADLSGGYARGDAATVELALVIAALKVRG